jgi:hypothetical protein
MRLVTVLAHINPFYGQITWHIAVCGFFIFFLYKYKVDRARSRIIEQQQLMKKVTRGGMIEESDRVIIGSILCAVSSNKDRINYSVIFTSSVIALIAALYFDFFR